MIMNHTHYLGKDIKILGAFPRTGEKIKQFELIKPDLDVLTSSSLLGKKCVLNIFPSVDHPVCAESIREFNRLAYKFPNVEIVCVSVDTPFALRRFCEREGLDYITPASCFRSSAFPFDYGVKLSDSKLAGFTASAVICVNEHGIISHSQLVEEITRSPNYQKVVDTLYE